MKAIRSGSTSGRSLSSCTKAVVSFTSADCEGDPVDRPYPRYSTSRTDVPRCANQLSSRLSSINSPLPCANTTAGPGVSTDDPRPVMNQASILTPSPCSIQMDSIPSGGPSRTRPRSIIDVGNMMRCWTDQTTITQTIQMAIRIRIILETPRSTRRSATSHASLILGSIHP